MLISGPGVKQTGKKQFAQIKHPAQLGDETHVPTSLNLGSPFGRGQNQRSSSELRTVPVTRRDMATLDDEYGLANRKSSKPLPETVRQPIKKAIR